MGARRGLLAGAGGEAATVLLVLVALAVRGARAQAQPFDPPTPPAMPMPTPTVPTPTVPSGPELLLTGDNCTQTITLAPPLYQAQEFRLVQAPGLRCVLTFVAAPPEPWRPLQWPWASAPAPPPAFDAYAAYAARRRRARAAHGPGLALAHARRRRSPDGPWKERSFGPWGGPSPLFTASAAPFSYGPPALPPGGAYGPPPSGGYGPPAGSHHPKAEWAQSPEFVEVVAPPKWRDPEPPSPSPSPWWSSWWWREPPPPQPQLPVSAPARGALRLLVQLRDVDVSPGVFDCELGGARVYSVRQGLPTLLLAACGADNASAALLSEGGVAVVTFASGAVATGSGLTVAVQAVPPPGAAPPPQPWHHVPSWRARRQGQAPSGAAARARLVAPPSYPLRPPPSPGPAPPLPEVARAGAPPQQPPFDRVDFYPGGYYYGGGCNATRWDGRARPLHAARALTP